MRRTTNHRAIIASTARDAAIWLILFTIAAKHALAIRFDGTALDYVAAVPVAMLAEVVALMVAFRFRNPIIPFLCGMVLLAILAVTAR